MRLRTKFVLAIGSIISIAFGITFYRTYLFQNDLIYEQSSRQARMLAQQILLTRKWVADHNGIFLVKQPGIEANPFLDDPEVRDASGQVYVKRNPAMVTRELSEYASLADFCKFRVTSLNPINPANAPDSFELQGLKSFESGATESLQIQVIENGRFLRYITALKVEEPCLDCHSQQGYQVGDIRGGLSLSMPMVWADKKAAANRRMLLFVATVTILLVVVAIFLLIDQLVVRRLNRLARFFAAFPKQTIPAKQLVRGDDEISNLGKNIIEHGHRLLSSQRQLEEAQEQMFQAEKLAALGRLSAGIAHDINNPLGGMRNCVKSLQEKPGDQELLSRYLALLSQGLQRIELIIRQLLNFARKEPLQYRQTVVDQIIWECLQLLEHRFKDIELQLELGLQKPLLIDVEAVKQVVVNIMMNAAQAMIDGGSLRVQTIQQGENIILSFQDNGPGIPADLLNKIFDPFFTTKEVGEGTGLGLAVCYSQVERMGGTIEVESKEGEGALFTVKLPIRMGTGQEEKGTP